MGLLAENKIRRKINKDPNNTKWTRDTNTFGQKILRAQGWQPGQFLGAENAPHSELHTAANASYIRVVLKDDMKGLGFSRSKEDEVTGLDVFQDLLSRLNGKTEDEVVVDQQARLAVKTHHFVEQRYGPMRFVYGGLLVGDEMKEKDDEEVKTPKDEDEDEDVVMESAPAPKESKKEKKSKKRKASEEDEDSSSRDSDSKSKKRRKEERKLKENDSSADTDDAKAKKKDKKSKKDKSRKKSADASEEESEERSKKRKSKSKDKSRSPEDSEEDKVKEKKSKKEKKEKKDKKRKKEEAASESSSTVATQESTPVPSIPGTGVTTPSGTSTPRGSRNFVRSRFIAQKRQAVLDAEALKQIFMVKA
ncbi:hypothetical protein Neosp_006302 [[Neocosmospora] mangrovei]